MHDFPPRIDAYTRAETARPDTRSPARFLLWTLRVQWDVLAALSIAGLAWFLPSALSPYLLGRTIDAGILVGDWAAMRPYCIVAVVDPGRLPGLHSSADAFAVSGGEVGDADPH